MVRPNDSFKWGREARDRFDALFAEAIQLGAEARARFLAALALREPTIAREIAALLPFHAEDDFLSPGPLSEELREALRDQVDLAAIPAGTRLGGFTIVRPLGQGGGSTVYEAEQEAPRRPVALKVMRSDVLHERVALRRFRDEAAALARLRHPEIAQVYAFGTARLDDHGGPETPFLAVEFVPQARTVTEWASATGATLRERVRLLARVCDAVAHGHARGILHRDLKPANILVDGDGRPRVIDFGIARMLDRAETQAASDMATTAGTWVGTPAYMSPEQFDGDPHDLDVRSDVYSLGVVLYETLVGRRPIEMPAWPTLEATQRARASAPPRPRSLDPRIDRDLETIVLVALSKRREDRHESMIALRDDLMAWVERRPIASRRPSLVRRATLAVRRNPPAAMALAAAVACAVVGVAATVRFAQRASDDRDASEASLRHFARMLDTPIAERDGERTRFSDVLGSVAHSLDLDRDTPPLVEARVRRMLGRGYDSIGLIPEAGVQFNRAVEILRRVAPDSPPLAAALTDAIGPMYDEHRHAAAELLGEEALRIQLRELGRFHPDTATTMNELGILELRQERFVEAFPLLLETFRIRQEVLGNEAVDTSTSLSNLGAAFLRLGDVAMAEALAKLALTWDAAEPSPPQKAANRLRLIALCRAEVGDDATAIEYLDRALAVLLQYYGPTHPSVISTHQRRAALLCSAGRGSEALLASEEAYQLASEVFPETSPVVVDAAKQLAEMRMRAASARE